MRVPCIFPTDTISAVYCDNLELLKDKLNFVLSSADVFQLTLQSLFAGCTLSVSYREKCVFYCHVMLRLSVAYAVMRCPSVCSSICLSRSCILLKRIDTSSKLLATLFYFFHTKRYDNILTSTALTGVECRCGMKKSLFFTSISCHRVLLTPAAVRCYQHGAATSVQVLS